MENEWVSVKDRLPEINKKVLVFAGGHVIETSIIKTLNNHNIMTKIDGKNLRWDYFAGCGHNGVTHWMPLPEPPKQ